MLKIRDFTPQDWEEYNTMSQEFYSSEAVCHTIPRENFRKTFDALMDNTPYARGVMLELDGVIVGYGLLALTWSNEAGGLTVWSEELYIKEEYRCRKLGSQYFEWLFREYPDAARHRLEISASNDRASHLYLKYGFDFLDYRSMIRDLH